MKDVLWAAAVFVAWSFFFLATWQLMTLYGIGEHP